MAAILLLEDDAALVRFFQLATEDLRVELHLCASVAEAMATLRRTAVQLIVTDLMLPGESGLVLLEQLREEPALRGQARVMVCSAGITAAVQAQLAGLEVWRQLHKPVSVADLRGSVIEGLGWAAAVDRGLGQAGAAVSEAAGARRDEEAALKRYFAGDRALFAAFRNACLQQFPEDLRTGDATLAARDQAGFRRVNHSLKSVFLSLGMAEASAGAKQLEEAAAGADWERSEALWPALRATLAGLAPAA